MGDTGSLALGATLAVVALISRHLLVLPLIAVIPVSEAVSVILQVGYFKLTHGKRLFRMAPIHHHFELGGMSEVQVVLMFWGFAALCCLPATPSFSSSGTYSLYIYIIQETEKTHKKTFFAAEKRNSPPAFYPLLKDTGGLFQEKIIRCSYPGNTGSPEGMKIIRNLPRWPSAAGNLFLPGCL